MNTSYHFERNRYVYLDFSTALEMTENLHGISNINIHISSDIVNTIWF